MKGRGRERDKTSKKQFHFNKKEAQSIWCTNHDKTISYRLEKTDFTSNMVEIKLSRGIINLSATRALQPLRHSILYKKCSANFPANMLFHRKSTASSTCLCLFDWIVIKRTRWWLTHTHKCMSCDIVHKHIFSSIFYTFEFDCIENKFYGKNEEMRKPHYLSFSSSSALENIPQSTET